MENTQSIKDRQKLLFIFEDEIKVDVAKDVLDNSCIIVFLYYLEDVEKYSEYIANIPSLVDLYIISSRSELLAKLKEILFRENTYYVLRDNTQGRDVSALLLEGKKIVEQYRYVCFLHDKRAHRCEEQHDVDLWIKNIWGNMIGESENHILQVLNVFEVNKNIGILVPPEPIGDYFCSWYGMGWHGSYAITEKLTKLLKLECDISEDIPPLGLGTALWFRTQALQKIFDYPWKAEDFDDTKLSDPNYLSYGIERIFSYVAQDAGYDSGEMMTVEYAKIQMIEIKRETEILLKKSYEYYPFPTTESANRVDNNVKRMMDYARGKKVALYGAGAVGSFCLALLRKNGIEPVSFVVTNKKEDIIDAMKVEQFDSFSSFDTGIIITPINQQIIGEIRKNIESKGYEDYFVFWE